MKKTLGLTSIILLITALAVTSASNFVGEVHATEVNSSIISSDTTWTKASSPYELHGPVAINQDATLTIEPGTTINLNNNYLQVNGTLIARGTSMDQILFNHGFIAFTPLAIGWNEQTKSGSSIENANFTGISDSYTNRYFSQITVEGASPKLANLQWVSSMSISEGGGSQAITNCQIIGALTISGSQTISGCIIQFASVTGAQRLQNNTIEVLTVKGSQIISDNVIKDLRIEGSPTVSNNRIGQQIAEVITTTSSITLDGNAIISSNTIYDGIFVSNGSPIIWNNTITYTPSGYDQQDVAAVVLPSDSTATVSNNHIKGGSASIPDYESLGMRPDRGPYYTFYGISCKGNQLIANNIITGCTKADVIVYGNPTIENNVLHGKGIIMDSPNATICFNNFLGQGSGIYLWAHAVGNINAANNWWGTADTAVINQAIYDFNDDFNLGTVNYTPFLNAPNAQAGPDQNAPMPTSISTASATPNPPSQSSIDMQSREGNPSSEFMPDLGFEQIAISVLVVLVAVLLVVVAFLVRKRKF